ncbi:hypothetical protein AWU01_02605 [Streptococcus pyogenes]|nr:hypothetical protein AWT93_05640 [Streptococcus pyogenes]OAC58461.1 hypothetical protein AWU03_08245 [Streptococcus pyogenes]OAC63792.1 hypothetical protein AWU05_03055 [Streptococcus pyogenes]OAC64638.1 hypothetical protein AWU06_02700 [Streptococcus pyogenes]OAC74071.1 hypothetical protein AWU01_02605 [Streptococcus pyogenes]
MRERRKKCLVRFKPVFFEKGISDVELSSVVQKILEEKYIKGLRFEQVNALTIMCELGYIHFDKRLSEVYEQALNSIGDYKK